jgi:hypothetical protein
MVRYIDYSSSQEITLDTSGVSIPFDGVLTFGSFYFTNPSAEVTGYVAIYVNNATVSVGSVIREQPIVRPITALVPVRKNDIVKFATNITAENTKAVLYAYQA